MNFECRKALIFNTLLPKIPSPEFRKENFVRKCLLFHNKNMRKNLNSQIFLQKKYIEKQKKGTELYSLVL